VDAIVNAPTEQLRIVMRALCADYGVLTRAKEFFAKVQEREEQLKASSNAGKRKLSALLETCIQCEEPLFEDDSDKDCYYHNVDHESSAWNDWDERCFGRVDTEENRKSYPKGFLYDCYNGDGDSEGCCKVGRHRAVGDKR
ncbi:hypothetical protein B0T17DRAFT_464177, partial [Bombardia bombarda]